MRVIAAIGSVLGVLLFASFFVGVNAGYVYRTECPRQGGSTETEWTHHFQQVIPYVGFSRSGCETHSATRIGFDKLGIMKIHRSVAVAPVDHRPEYSEANISSIAKGCVNTGSTQAFCDCMAQEMATRISPVDYNRVATAFQAGAKSYSDLPSDLADDMRAVAEVADRDC